MRAYLTDIVYYAEQRDQGGALSALYPPYSDDQKRYDVQNMLQEAPQTTGNCVIKNKLLAFRDAIRNDRAYNTIYEALLSATLSNRTYLSTPALLPSTQDVSYSVLNSQLSFLTENTHNPSSSSVADALQVCTPQEEDEHDPFMIILGVIAGAAAGGMASKACGSRKNKGASTRIAALIGGLAGGFLAAQASKKTTTKTKCAPLPERSQHCYSCP